VGIATRVWWLITAAATVAVLAFSAVIATWVDARIGFAGFMVVGAIVFVGLLLALSRLV
jgi:hypothetical protein